MIARTGPQVPGRKGAPPLSCAPLSAAQIDATGTGIPGSGWVPEPRGRWDCSSWDADRQGSNLTGQPPSAPAWEAGHLPNGADQSSARLVRSSTTLGAMPSASSSVIAERESKVHHLPNVHARCAADSGVSPSGAMLTPPDPSRNR